MNMHKCLPMLGDEFISWQLSLPVPLVLLVAHWAPTPPWCSSCLSSKLPIKALRMISSRPKLLAGSLKDWLRGLMTPIFLRKKKKLHLPEDCQLCNFYYYLLELVTAGKLKISVPGCAFPARKLNSFSKGNFRELKKETVSPSDCLDACLLAIKSYIKHGYICMSMGYGMFPVN